MNGKPDPSQTAQRVKVGIIGLAAVILLIALASVIIGSATRERPVTGSAQVNVMAEIVNNGAMDSSGEPLAEMGVAPSASNLQDAISDAQ